MINDIFGEMVFDTGWKSKMSIELFGKTDNITVKAKAYYEKDGITPEQEAAFSDFTENILQRIASIEKMISDYNGERTANQYTPQTILFERDGSYALLLDDNDDLDNGIAIGLVPEEKILSQDEYL